MSQDGVSDAGSGYTSDTNAGRKTPADTAIDVMAGALDAEALRVLAEEVARDSSLELTHTALVLYDLDPGHLQAQWYVVPDDLAQALRAFPHKREDVRQVLRLRRLEHGGLVEVAASVVREPVASKGQGEERFCLDAALSGDGVEYECELGMETDDGGWLLLARSNRIGVADRDHPPPGIASTSNTDLAQDPESASIPEFGEYLHTPVEPALAAVGGRLHPVFPTLDLGVKRAGTGFSLEEQALARGLARDPESESSPVTMPHPAPATARVVHLRRGVDLLAMPPPLLPSMPDLAPPAGALGPLYDPRAALSSAAPRGAQPLLSGVEIQAELIVQGRASPGSTVDLFGHAVPVGADGRFYVRRPIEDPRLLSVAIGGHPEAGEGDPGPE